MKTSKFFNIEAEIAIIGSILLDNDSILSVVNNLKPIDFYGAKLNQVGGVTYISQILGSSATSLNISSLE